MTETEQLEREGEREWREQIDVATLVQGRYLLGCRGKNHQTKAPFGSHK
jgi:hypothetical protein